MAKDEKIKKSKKVKEQKNSFLKDSKSELKKVIWPTPKSLANDTATVVGIVLFVAIIVVILDFIFVNINEKVILKAEENVKNNRNSIVTEIDNTNSVNTENQNSEENTENQDNGSDENTEQSENTENSAE